MAQNETWLAHDLMNAVKVQYLDGNLFSQDNAGNLIGVTMTRDGANYSGGGSVSANVIRADGATVAVTGALSGNKATVVLPQAAYAVPGVVSIVIKLTVNGEVTTIGAVVGNVYQSSTDTAVDPGTVIPDVEALIAAIDEAVASIPADYSSLWTSLAPAFSTIKDYQVGQYVTYNGDFYRFILPHSAGSWNTADVEQTDIGKDLSDVNKLKFPVSGVTGQIVFSRFNYGGSSWTGHMNYFYLYKNPIIAGIKKLKVKCVLQSSQISLMLIKRRGNDYVLVSKETKSSGTSGEVTFENVIFEGACYLGIGGPCVTRTDVAVSPGYIGDMSEITDNVLGTLTDNTYGFIFDLETMSQPSDGLNPDFFEGTDTEKLQQAFDYCATSGGVINIRRKFTISSTITISHQYEEENRIVVQGSTAEAELSSATTYSFRSSNASKGGIIFRDIKITNGAVSSVHAFLNGGSELNSATLVNIVFENCWFSGFPQIYNAVNYCQSLWLINCVIRNISSSVIYTAGYQWYNVNILHCIIEQVNTIGSIGYPQGVNIKDCVIEGNTSATCINLVGGAYSINIEGNYFEANGTDINMASMSSAERNVRIVGNFFSNTEGNSIVLPTSANDGYTSTITIMNNKHMNQNGKYLVSGTSGQVYDEVFCAFNSGAITDLPGTGLHVLTPSNFF